MWGDSWVRVRLCTFDLIVWIQCGATGLGGFNCMRKLCKLLLCEISVINLLYQFV